MRVQIAATAALLAVQAAPSRAAEPVMVRCGREYQAAKAADTLNGLNWSAYRSACADRLKAGPAVVPAAATAAATAATPPAPSAPPATPATPAAGGPPAVISALPSAPTPSTGLAAMHARQKQCGAEWTATKAALVAATPGLTWPKYWSQCNTRLKAAGTAGG